MEMTYNYEVQYTGLPIKDRLKLGVYCNKGELLEEEILVTKDAMELCSTDESIVRVFSKVEEKIERCSSHNDRYHATVKDADTNEVLIYVHISTMFERSNKANSIGMLFKDVLNRKAEV